MKKNLIIICIAVGISLTLTTTSFAAPTLFLDADSLTTGIYSAGSPLVISTTYGDISFVGELRSNPGSDTDFTGAGGPRMRYSTSLVITGLNCPLVSTSIPWSSFTEATTTLLL